MFPLKTLFPSKKCIASNNFNMNSGKKYVSINFLLIALFITNLSFAQKTVIGIKLGLALSNATIDETGSGTATYSTSTNAGILGGIYLDVPSGKELVFRPEAEIVSKGFRRNDNYSSGDYPVRFSYIDFPANILYKKDFTNGHFIAGGGPVIGFPINHSYLGYPLNTEFSINGVIGYELAIGFSINVNYTYGLTNASKDKQYVSKISNRYLGIAVGYSF